MDQTVTLNIDKDQLFSLVMQLPETEQRDLVRRIMSSLNDSFGLKVPPVISMSEIERRIEEAEDDIKNGRFVIPEDMHRTIEEKFPWLKD